MGITILCETNNLLSGAPGYVVTTQLGWLRFGDPVRLHLREHPGEFSSLKYQGRDYPVVIHALSSNDDGQTLVFARVLN